LPHPRVGLIVPKHSHSAVERNTLKRRLREISRRELLPVLAPVDVVVRARREAYDASYDELRRALMDVVPRLRGAEERR